MLSLLRRRPAFRRLWIAASASLIGDWLSFVAISLLAMDRGGGALSLALVFAVHALPHALFTPISGVVADRLDRRTVLIVVPLVQAALTVAMALAAGSGMVWLVQMLVLVRSAGTAFMVPAEAAALRHTVEPGELVPANAILSGTWSITYIAGMVLGGAIASLGAVPAILIDAWRAERQANPGESARCSPRSREICGRRSCMRRRALPCSGASLPRRQSRLRVVSAGLS
jgi:MFS family permease